MIIREYALSKFELMFECQSKALYGITRIPWFGALRVLRLAAVDPGTITRRLRAGRGIVGGRTPIAPAFSKPRMHGYLIE